MSFKGFSLDFTGVEPAGDFSVVLQAGYYKGKVTGIRDHKDKDGAWLDILVPSQRGRTGGPVGTYMATPTDPNGFPARKWVSLLIAAGFAKEKVQGKQRITEKTVLGKEITFRYQPPPPSEDADETTYAEITFISPADFAEAVKDELAGSATTTPAAAPPATKPATTKPAASKPAAPPAAPPPSTDDLDKELGLE